MTLVLACLALLQAGLLLAGALHLSNVFLRLDRLVPLVWAVLTLGGAVAVARLSAGIDLKRILCTAGDCVALVIPVACVRVIVVTKENERLSLERDVAALLAAEAAKAARKAQAARQVAAATAALEARGDGKRSGTVPTPGAEDLAGPASALRASPRHRGPARA